MKSSCCNVCGEKSHGERTNLIYDVEWLQESPDHLGSWKNVPVSIAGEPDQIIMYSYSYLNCRATTGTVSTPLPFALSAQWHPRYWRYKNRASYKCFSPTRTVAWTCVYSCAIVDHFFHLARFFCGNLFTFHALQHVAWLYAIWCDSNLHRFLFVKPGYSYVNSGLP